MNDLRLDLTIEETNLVLGALGNMPFKQVFGLMGKIQEQAQQQLATTEESSDAA